MPLCLRAVEPASQSKQMIRVITISDQFITASMSLNIENIT